MLRPTPGDGADLRPAAKELEPRARFAKVNVDEEPSIGARYRIHAAPTPIVLDQGKVAKQHARLVHIIFFARPDANGLIAGFARRPLPISPEVAPNRLRVS